VTRRSVPTDHAEGGKVRRVKLWTSLIPGWRAAIGPRHRSILAVEDDHEPGSRKYRCRSGRATNGHDAPEQPQEARRRRERSSSSSPGSRPGRTSRTPSPPGSPSEPGPGPTGSETFEPKPSWRPRGTRRNALCRARLPSSRAQQPSRPRPVFLAGKSVAPLMNAELHDRETGHRQWTTSE
jgi:hypothetical protein